MYKAKEIIGEPLEPKLNDWLIANPNIRIVDTNYRVTTLNDGSKFSSVLIMYKDVEQMASIPDDWLALHMQHLRKLGVR